MCFEHLEIIMNVFLHKPMYLPELLFKVLVVLQTIVLCSRRWMSICGKRNDSTQKNNTQMYVTLELLLFFCCQTQGFLVNKLWRCNFISSSNAVVVCLVLNNWGLISFIRWKINNLHLILLYICIFFDVALFSFLTLLLTHT